MKYIKKDKIETISIYYDSINYHYYLCKGISLLGFTIKKRGFYDYDGFVSKEDIEKEDNIVEGKLVYKKPHIVIKTKEHSKTIYFDTKAKLDLFLEKNIDLKQYI